MAFKLIFNQEIKWESKFIVLPWNFFFFIIPHFHPHSKELHFLSLFPFPYPHFQACRKQMTDWKREKEKKKEIKDKAKSARKETKKKIEKKEKKHTKKWPPIVFTMLINKYNYKFTSYSMVTV